MRLLAGVPGVGKSTVASQLAQAGYPVTNLGDLMLRAARSQGMVIERDQLRELNRETREALRTSAARLVAPRDVLDVHLTIRTASGLEPAMPSALPPAALAVLLEAPARDILARRKARPGRSDPTDTEDDIVQQQAANRREAHRLAGAAVTIVDAAQSKDLVFQKAAAALGSP